MICCVYILVFELLSLKPIFIKLVIRLFLAQVVAISQLLQKQTMLLSVVIASTICIHYTRAYCIYLIPEFLESCVLSYALQLYFMVDCNHIGQVSDFRGCIGINGDNG